MESIPREMIEFMRETDEIMREMDLMEQYFSGERQGILITKIHQIRKKMAKGKTVEAIAVDLEEETPLIEKILKTIQENPNFSDSQIAELLIETEESVQKISTL